MRDTDKDWNLIADKQPYFGVLSNAQFRTENLTDKHRADFFKTGEDDIAHVAAVFQRDFGEFAPKSGLDFGSGVGRLLIPMSKRVGTAIGVDIAESMRRITEENLRARNITNAQVVASIPSTPVDWVNSWIVLQHIPPARGYEILNQLWKLLTIGGYLSLQITLYKDASQVHGITRDVAAASYDGDSMRVYAPAPQLEEGTMTMYDYDLNRLIAMFEQQDAQRMVLEHTNHGGCRGVKMYMRKMM